MFPPAESVVLRRALPDEAASLVAFVNEAYGYLENWAGAPIAASRMTLAEMENLLAGPSSAILLAVEPGDTSVIRGSVCCSMSPVETGKNPEQAEGLGRVATIGMLAVEPSHQSRGIGSLLVRYAQQYAVEEWCATEIQVYVVTTRTMLSAWYERMGYVRLPETCMMPAEHRARLFNQKDAEMFVYQRAFNPQEYAEDKLGRNGRTTSKAP